MSQQNNNDAPITPGVGNYHMMTAESLQQYLEFVNKCLDLMTESHEEAGIYFSQNIKELNTIKQNILNELTERSFLS